jgi:hypothetical protein
MAAGERRPRRGASPVALVSTLPAGRTCKCMSCCSTENGSPLCVDAARKQHDTAHRIPAGQRQAKRAAAMPPSWAAVFMQPRAR